MAIITAVHSKNPTIYTNMHSTIIITRYVHGLLYSPRLAHYIRSQVLVVQGGVLLVQ